MSTKTKTTALEEVRSTALANGWNVTDLGEVSFRTQGGSFGRDGVEHAGLQALQIEWTGAERSRYLVFFKPSGAFHLAAPGGDWAGIVQRAAHQAEQRVKWFHDANEGAAAACLAHGVEIGVSYPKRKGMVSGSGYSRYSLTHQIVNEGKEYLVLAPYSEDTIAQAFAKAEGEARYRLIGQTRITKTELLDRLVNNPGAIEALRAQQRLERATADAEREQVRVVETGAALTSAQAVAYQALLRAGLTEQAATAVVVMAQDEEDNVLAALTNAAHQARIAKARSASADSYLASIASPVSERG